MKRTFAKLLSLFVVLTLVIAMVPAVFAVDGTVSAAKTTLKVGENTTISATDSDNNSIEGVSFKSDHPEIVSVENKTLTAKKVGTAVITATVTDEGGTTPRTLGSVTITVQSGVSAITADTSVEIDVDSLATASLSVKLTGAASGDVLAVRSSDESIVTVPASVDASTDSCSVTLTAVKTGTATVTLSCGTATAQVAVTVKATKDHTVTFEKQKLTVKKGETAVNPATKAPAAGDKLTYASSSTAVAAMLNAE